MTLSLKLALGLSLQQLRKTVDYYPLELLNDGQEARIVEICGDDVQVHRLAEIGIRAGCCLRMIRTGVPSLLAVDGRRLSLRLNDNVNIFVASMNANFAEAV